MADENSYDPLEHFEASRAKLGEALEHAAGISGGAIGIEHTGRQNRSLMVFSKMIAHGMSIEAVLGPFPSDGHRGGFLNHFSLIALARTVYDAALMTLYVAHLSSTEDQWNLRRHVLYLHDLCNRKRFLKPLTKIEPAVQPIDNSTYQRVRDDLTLKISLYGRKLGKNDKEISELCTGQRVFVDGARGAARLVGWDLNAYDFKQAFFSNWVHSHPVSFLRANEQKISMVEASDHQLAVSALALDTAWEATDACNEVMSNFVGTIERDPLGPIE
ncbi:hypothetical protein V8J82_20255 [Gymnodinialimonas sp. 2305UL16-5]|uniref:hypothetical protein n=1 Tax=Gymnodinialimonas mytili TaxID=3126503 RepID=UPI0030AD27E8